MYGERIRDLKRDLAIRDILVTRRHPRTGSRIRHPYSRLTAIPIIFDEGRRKLDEAATTTATSIAASTATSSGRSWPTVSGWSTRRSGSWSLVPYAARPPFETWILPRQHACRL